MVSVALWNEIVLSDILRVFACNVVVKATLPDGVSAIERGRLSAAIRICARMKSASGAIQKYCFVSYRRGVMTGRNLQISTKL